MTVSSRKRWNRGSTSEIGGIPRSISPEIP